MASFAFKVISACEQTDRPGGSIILVGGTGGPEISLITVDEIRGRGVKGGRHLRQLWSRQVDGWSDSG